MRLLLLLLLLLLYHTLYLSQSHSYPSLYPNPLALSQSPVLPLPLAQSYILSLPSLLCHPLPLAQCSILPPPSYPVPALPHISSPVYYPTPSLLSRPCPSPSPVYYTTPPSSPCSALPFARPPLALLAYFISCFVPTISKHCHRQTMHITSGSWKRGFRAIPSEIYSETAALKVVPLIARQAPLAKW